MEHIDNQHWRKSSYSGNNGGDCVEVADRDNTVMVRDTKSRESGHLAVDAAAWARFVGDVKTTNLRIVLTNRASVIGV